MPFPLNKQDKCQCIKLVCVSKEQIASLKLNSYAFMNSWWFSVSSIAKCQSSAHQQQNNGREIQSSSECKSLARRRVEHASAMILTRQLIITSCHGHWDDFFQLTCWSSLRKNMHTFSSSTNGRFSISLSMSLFIPYKNPNCPSTLVWHLLACERVSPTRTAMMVQKQTTLDAYVCVTKM